MFGERLALCGLEGMAFRGGSFAASGVWISGMGGLIGGTDLDILDAFPSKSCFISSRPTGLVEPDALEESSVGLCAVL